MAELEELSLSKAETRMVLINPARTTGKAPEVTIVMSCENPMIKQLVRYAKVWEDCL